MKLAFTFFALGVLVGVLIAPEKGSVLRAKLSQVGDDLAQAKQHLTGEAPSV